MDDKTLQTWMTFFKLLMDKPLAKELESSTDDQNVIKSREQNIFWLNKKWSAKIVDLMFYRHGDKKNETKQTASSSS